MTESSSATRMIPHASTVGPPVVYLGLGSNLGDRLGNLRAAVDRVRQLGDVEAVSRVYESAPVGYLDQGDFLNLVIRLRSELDPNALFSAVKRIERELGRTAAVRNGPRAIDIDILTYNDLVLDAEELTIPHPRMLERSFVIAPLLDVALDFRHPATGADAAALRAKLNHLPPVEPRFTL